MIRIKFRHIASLISGLILTMILSSCGSTATMTTGLENESYIIVTSDNQYKNKEVVVRVDDMNTYEVKALPSKHVVRKGKRIVVHPGSHDVVVKDRAGKTLFDKTIFVSSRFSKLIELP